MEWRSQPDSNRCYSLERAMSWASRRWERGPGLPGRAHYREAGQLLKLSDLQAPIGSMSMTQSGSWVLLLCRQGIGADRGKL
jgi:hypothetical protein